VTPPLNKLQAEARRAFRATKLGKLLTETKREIDTGRANVKLIMQAGHNMRQLAGSDVTRELMSEMGLGSSWAMIERYAGKDAWKKIVSQLGSVGKILKSLSEGNTKQQPVGVERELEAAANLLKAFGYGIQKPGGNVSVAPQHAPEFSEIDPRVQQQIIKQEERKQRVEERLRNKPLPFWPGYNVPLEKKSPEEPLTNMQTEMIPVSSSNVHSIGFRYDNPDMGTLLVRYLAQLPDGRRGGPGSLYEYFHVPSLLFERFKQASSKGGFVWDELRIRGTRSGHKFNYDLSGITGGYVPRRAQTIYFRGPRGGLRASEAYVPRLFNVGEIRKGKLQMRQIRSQLPEQRVGKSFAVRRGRR
jgi:hypothetical protein